MLEPNIVRQRTNNVNVQCSKLKKKKMSPRTLGNASLMDNTLELLDQAHHLLVQAEELLRKDENPMALGIHDVDRMLLAITLKVSQQRREKLPHLKQHIRYVHRARPVVASRPKVNPKRVQRNTSIFTAGDEQTLTEGFFDDCHLNNDTDVDSTSSSNLETFTKKRKPVKKSEVTSSCKLNASGSEQYAKKKRKDTGTEKQLKVQPHIYFCLAFDSFANTKLNY
jgi:hypothetical protein